MEAARLPTPPPRPGAHPTPAPTSKSSSWSRMGRPSRRFRKRGSFSLLLLVGTLMTSPSSDESSTPMPASLVRMYLGQQGPGAGGGVRAGNECRNRGGRQCRWCARTCSTAQAREGARGEVKSPGEAHMVPGSAQILP